MAIRYTSCFIFILLLLLGCKEDNNSGECGAPASDFRFKMVDKETNRDLFFDKPSQYDEDDLEIYVITKPLSLNPADTINYAFLNAIDSEEGRIFITTLPTSPNEKEADTVYVRIGDDIDTLITFPRSVGFYDNGRCERIEVDQVYYNGEVICDGCNDSTVYLLRK